MRAITRTGGPPSSLTCFNSTEDVDANEVMLSVSLLVEVPVFGVSEKVGSVDVMCDVCLLHTNHVAV